MGFTIMKQEWEEINNLRFADDIDLINDSTEALQESKRLLDKANWGKSQHQHIKNEYTNIWQERHRKTNCH